MARTNTHELDARMNFMIYGSYILSWSGMLKFMDMCMVLRVIFNPLGNIIFTACPPLGPLYRASDSASAPNSLMTIVFVQVSKNFADVFKELVPTGKGQLVMKRVVDAVSRCIHVLCVYMSSLYVYIHVRTCIVAISLDNFMYMCDLFTYIYSMME